MNMTWVHTRKGWMKKYRNKMFTVSCRQLGCEPTKEASWRAAREWWEKKQAEIDAEPTAEDDDRRLARSLLIAEMIQLCPDGDFPEEVQVAILGKERLDELRRKAMSLFVAQDPDRTVGSKSDAWCRSLMAGVDAGRIDVSRYGSYKRDVARFTEWIGVDSGLDSLDEDALERFYSELARRVRDGRYSPDYARTIFGATKQFISWLAGMKSIPLPGNMASRKFRFGAGKTVTKDDLFTDEEIRRLLGVSGERLRLFVLLMLNCGMYQSDVSDLGEDEVDWDAGTIERPRSKTGKVTKYKLWPATFALLKAHRNTIHPVLNERGSRRVLVTKDGRPLCAYWIEGDRERRYDTVRGLYARVKETAGLTKPMKNLRKTSATKLGAHPMYKFYAQYFLAQSPGSVADNHYVIPSEDEFFEALDWLNKQYPV